LDGFGYKIDYRQMKLSGIPQSGKAENRKQKAESRN
jgi:hypothetical protein